ncbi:MAG: DMT family transporter [Pseudomonadota bacterium]
MRRSAVLSSVLLAIAGIASIAYGSVLAAESESGPLATSFFRFSLAAPFCLAIGLLIDRGAAGALRLIGRWQIWLAGLAFAATVSLWYEGQRLSTVASAGAVHNLAPVVVIGIGWIVYRTLPRPSGVVGLILVIFGGFLLVYEDFIEFGGSALLGDELALASAFTLAVYWLCIEELSEDASAFTLIGLAAAIAAPCVLVPALMSNEPLLPVNSSGWAILIGVAFFGQIGGHAALARAAVSIGAFGVTTVGLAEPALAAVLALILLAQPVSLAEWTGIGVLALGMALAQHGFRRFASGDRNS